MSVSLAALPHGLKRFRAKSLPVRVKKTRYNNEQVNDPVGSKNALNSRIGLIMSAESSNENVRALARGLSVIEAFGGSRQGRTLADIARDTGLSRATARRLLLTLAELGYVSTNGRLFALTPRILTLCYSYLSSVALTDILMPHMEAVLAGTSHVSSSAAMLDQSNIVFIAGVPAKGFVRAWMTVGLKLPAFASSMGRVLLSHQSPDKLERLLAQTRYQSLTEYTETDPAKILAIISDARVKGYALCNRELDVAVKACAVPIYNRLGNCWAAISVSCHNPQRSMDDVVAEFVPKLRTAADRATASLPSDAFVADWT